MKPLPPTKRSILQVSAKIFNPLGLLSLIVIGIEMLFQTLCKSKLNWDSILEGDLLRQWQRLTEEFEAISQISIPWCYLDLQQHCIMPLSHGSYTVSVMLRCMDVLLLCIYVLNMKVDK